MKKIRLLLLAAVIVAAGSAFTTKNDGFRYFRNGVEIFDTSPCVSPISEKCFDVYDATGTEQLGQVYGTWIDAENK